MNRELISLLVLATAGGFGTGMLICWVILIGQHQIRIPGERMPLETPPRGNSIFEIRHRRGGMVLKLDCYTLAIVHLTTAGVFVPIDDLRVFVDREEQFPR